MPEAVVENFLYDYGLLGVALLALYAIVKWVLKQNEIRENRYLQTIGEQNEIIKALSEQLPELRAIKEVLGQIQVKMDSIGRT